MPRHVRIVGIILLVLFAWSLALAQGAKTLKIGYIATMSGPAASLGQDILDGFKLGISHAGQTLGGMTVELIVGDDQLKPDVGVPVASKMLEKDKVDFINGVVFSNVMMAIAQPITNAGVFLISAHAGPSPLAGAGCLPNLFTVSWQNDQTHEAMGKYSQDTGIKRLYLMAPNYQAGKDALVGVKRYFQGEIVGEVYTTLNQPDYAAELTQLRAAKPEAVYAFYPGEMHALIGPNGAGKTTLIGHVSGEITPDAGRRQFAGHDITALPMHQRVARGITRSYQITSLFPHLRGRGCGGKRCYELSPLRPTMARDKFSLVLACMCSQEKWLRC